MQTHCLTRAKAGFSLEVPALKGPHPCEKELLIHPCASILKRCDALKDLIVVNASVGCLRNLRLPGQQDSLKEEMSVFLLLYRRMKKGLSGLRRMRRRLLGAKRKR